MRLQIGTGAERLVARTGQDGHPEIRIVPEVFPYLPEQLVGFEVDGVHGLGTVERHIGDLSPLVVQDL